jgi:ATP phosphoribosyltransferase regulatory subunit HisZ
MSSKKTIEKDLGVKFNQYQLLGVHEYFLFDPDRRVLRPALQGYRLVGGRYDQLLTINDALESDLGFRMRIEGQILRLSDGRTGKPVLFPAEQVELAREQVERERQRADEERRRVEQLEAELRALRQQLGQTGGPATP